MTILLEIWRGRVLALTASSFEGREKLSFLLSTTSDEIGISDELEMLLNRIAHYFLSLMHSIDLLTVISSSFVARSI